MCFFLEGRKVRKSTGTSNKRLAQHVYEKTRAQVATGTFNPRLRANMPFFELVDEFLEKHSKVEKASYKRDKVIGEALKKYFGRTPIGQIRAYDIIEWRKWRMQHVTRTGTLIKKASINRELAFMKTMFGLAVEWGWLKENPAEKVKLLRGEEKRLRILNREEIDRLIASARASLKPIIKLAISTGMRKSEILNLKWKHTDLSNGFVRVGSSKNDEARNVPIDLHIEATLLKLKKGKSSEDYVFSRKNGARVRCIKEAFKAACDRAGIVDFRFHDLRHTAASLLAAGGCDIITLQYVLGHKTLSMTQRYAHLIPGRHELIKEIMGRLWGNGDAKLTHLSTRPEQARVIH
jgi:integrase